MQPDAGNTYFQLAADLVNYTDKHVFLSGKAGTGKTTFLKYIKEHSPKNTVVVAPTGVAAINAGGVTMHSFFQLPFSPFLPQMSWGFGTEERNHTDKSTLIKNIRFNKDKIELLQELELLIIDEVSMLRCDMLDAIDTILRHFRKKVRVPFGGVQVLYIGDLLQLPPVVKEDEWQMMEPYYKSPFFFDAMVLADEPPLYVELQKIYRQTEQQFIDVLNKVRNNEVTEADYAILNDRYQPHIIPDAEDKFITLTTHNHKADAINARELQKLEGKSHTFRGEIEREFSDKNLPVEMDLQLKVNAQVMFIKNDVGNDRRFYNGKLAEVKRITREEIVVVMPDKPHDELVLEKETWRNIRYKYNKETNKLEEEEIGSYKQYPIRLAWAITIHKSQGLTFQKAIIDAGSSFAAGQVYVALSRCTSLSGLMLLSKITPSGITTDHRVVNYLKQNVNVDRLKEIVDKERKRYLGNQLSKAFELDKVEDAIEDFRELIRNKKLPDQKAGIQLLKQLNAKISELVTIADKFQPLLRHLLEQANNTAHTGPLIEKTQNAIHYFSTHICEGLLAPITTHIAEMQSQKKVKGYLKEMYEIEKSIVGYLQKLWRLSYDEVALCTNTEQYTQHWPSYTKEQTAVKKEKKEVGSSQQETLRLFREHKSAEEIAMIRRLAVGTIETHLISFLKTGEVTLYEIVAAEKANAITKAMDNLGEDASMTIVKQQLGENFTFSEIRAVFNDRQRKKELG